MLFVRAALGAGLSCHDGYSSLLFGRRWIRAHQGNATGQAAFPLVLVRRSYAFRH
jgi:hypothetical protein